MTPGRVSERLVTAPNVQFSAGGTMAEAWRGRVNAGETAFKAITVETGPPEAVLKVVELPAAAYGGIVESELQELQEKWVLNVRFEFLRPTNRAARLKPKGTIFLLHGYMGSKEMMYPWAFLLAQAGFQVMAVDLRGHGESSGEMISFGKFETRDLMRVLDAAVEQGRCPGRIGVLGISMGADLALHWMARDERIETAVAIAPYDEPEAAFRRFAAVQHLPIKTRVLNDGLALAGERLGIRWADWSGQAAVRKLRKPVLFIGGGRDAISPPEEVFHLAGLAPEGSRCVMVERAGHDTIGLWFHEIGAPVKEWFGERLAGSEAQGGGGAVN